MIKHFVWGMAVLLSTSCSARDENYYRLNPEKVEQALKSCPAMSPGKISCNELKAVSARQNQLAYELQLSPQGFGQRILLLQIKLAEQKQALKENSSQPELKQLISQNEQKLAEYLAIVKWLESPES
ncbi:secreted endonuclease [Legionella birminghamensis]|uniref:Secreted endonuclease n=1 Tax=Legionella birminghamensis TaxID=28083 RepID=A0A378I8N3_9GAMM|nr:hypothetical protein [Legionella birminghamensis]KTC74706.1 secreted endonuclease [Legionella birminghamensis]STX31509.1 secreted endonuclease [Legionella birminghamensis]